MSRTGILCILIFLVLPAAVQGLVFGNGDQVRFDQRVDDDVFAAGRHVSVNAPVRSLIAVGGEVLVNAPVEGDVIAAGGTIAINAPVGGKVVLAGGMVTLNSSIVRNVLVYAADVVITRDTVVGDDALVSAGKVTNSGEVKGNFTVSSQQFTDTGKAGHLSYTRDQSTLGEDILGFLSLAVILFSLGLGILGLVLIRLAPGPFRIVEGEIRTRPLVKVLAGLGGILGGIVLTVILAITLIGMPLALCTGMGLVAGLLFSTLFVSSSLGRVIVTRSGRTMKEWQYFLLGFVILQVSFRIPYVGLVILAVSLCLGFGALLYAVAACRTHISRGERPG